MLQRCNSCGQQKDAEKDFHKQDGKPKHVCKVCTRDKRRERRRRQREAKYTPSTSTTPAKELLRLQTVADIPPELGPIHSLDEIELKTTDHLTLRGMEGVEDVLVLLERRMKIANGR